MLGGQIVVTTKKLYFGEGGGCYGGECLGQYLIR